MLLLLLLLPHFIRIWVLELQLRIILHIQPSVPDTKRLVNLSADYAATHAESFHESTCEAAFWLWILEAQVLRPCTFGLTEDDFKFGHVG